MSGKPKLDPGVIKLGYQPRDAAAVIVNPPKLPDPPRLPEPSRPADPKPER